MADVSSGAPRERLLELNGTQLRVVERGEGPAVVYLHSRETVAPNRAPDLVAARCRLLELELPVAPHSSAESAQTIDRALDALDLDEVNVWGAGPGGEVAIWLAIHHPQRVGALVLEAPSGVTLHTSDEPSSPLERELGSVQAAVLVVFGTDDDVLAPETGRVYKTLIPNCHLVYVYDAGHHVSAQRPEAFVEIALDFMDRREQFVVGRASTALFP